MSTDNPEDDLGPISEDELNQLINEFKSSPDKSADDSESSLASLAGGDRPEILKDAIEDSALLSRLMGRVVSATPETEGADPDEESSDSSLLNQDELDALIASQLASSSEEEEESHLQDMAQAPRGDLGIEREEIEDAGVLGRLMGSAAAPASDEPADDEDFGLLDQDELDRLVEQGKQIDVAKASGEGVKVPPAPVVDMSVKPEGFDEVEEDLGLLDEDELNALFSGGGSEETETVSEVEDSVAEVAEETAPEEPVVEVDGAEDFDQSAIDALIAGGGDDSPAEVPAEEPVESAADEAFDQSAIDALIAGGGDDAPAEEPVESASDEAFDQSAIDALIAGGGDDTPAEVPAEEPVESAADEAFDQSAIDALIAGGGDDTPAEVPAEEPVESAADEAFDQSAIDALIAGGGDDAPAEVPAEEPVESGADEAFDQSAIDALIAGGGDDTPAEVPAEEPVESAADEAFDQSAIDALIAGGGDDAPAAVEEVEEEIGGIDQSAIDALIADTADEEPDIADDTAGVDQAAIDAMIAGAAEVEDDPAEDEGAEEPISVSQDDIDALLVQGLSGDDSGESDVEDSLEALLEEELKSVSGDEESLLAEGDAQDPLVEVDMEERLDGGNEDQLTEDAAEALVVEDALPEDILEGLVQEPDEAPEPVSEEATGEVANENLAAGSTADTDESVEPPAAEDESTVEAEPEVAAPVAARVDDDSEEEEESIITAGEWLRDVAKVPVVLVHIIGEQPLRSVTGIAAGIIVALSAYLYLSANQLQSVSDYITVSMDEEGQLRRTMLEASILIEEGDYAEASSVLEKAMEDANEKSPVYLDALYIKLDADVRQAPDSVSTKVANRLHSEIDHIVGQSALHPRKPEALLWKGKLYEKENNVLAARVEYRELLKNEMQAENRHEALLALGELELKTDRPIQAATYLQQLRRQFPGTDAASKARYLLGEAYAASGDMESARTTFIDAAEADPSSKIGADAFARLGELALESGDYEQAVRELEGRLNRATSLEGNDRVTLLLAKAYRASGRLEDAKNVLNSLIDFFPESDITPLARIELSRVLDELGLEREAVRYATQTVQAYPDHPGALRNAGELLQKKGDVLDAARSLLAAHYAGMDDPELLLAAGRLFAESEAYTDAKNAFKTLSEEYARTRQGLMGNIALAELLFEEGRVSEALSQLEGLALVTNSSSRKLPVLTALGGIYQKLRLPSKVAEVYGEIAVLTNEPELLAQSATAMLESGIVDEGLLVASEIEVQQLSAPVAYAFLNAKGHGTMLKDAKEGLGYLEQAYAGYPEQRTSRGVQKLLEANLTLDRTARARAIVSELGTHVMQRDMLMERPRLEKAAITWGNYLFNRQDYRAAADAYGIALEAQVVGVRWDAPNAVLSDMQLWSLFQQANAYFKLSDYDDSIALYDVVATSTSMWAPEAATKATSARLEQRLRGEPVAEVRNAG